MSIYDSSSLNISELTELAIRVAEQCQIPTAEPWTYQKTVYETVEKQTKTGGIFGLWQKTLTTTEDVRTKKTIQLLDRHWILAERSECRREKLGSTRELGATHEELITTTYRYALTTNGDLVRATMVEDTLIRYMRENDTSIERTEVRPFEESDYLELDKTMTNSSEVLTPTETLEGNMRTGTITAKRRGDGLRKRLDDLL